MIGIGNLVYILSYRAVTKSMADSHKNVKTNLEYTQLRVVAYKRVPYVTLSTAV